MNSLISAELLKLRTTRASYVALTCIVIWAVAGPVLVAVAPAGATVPELEPTSLAEMMRGPARLAGGAMLLIGLLASTGEFRYGTVLTTRLAEPRNTRILLAKVATLTGVGLIVGVLLDIVTGGAGALLLLTHDVSVQPFANDVPRVALLVPLLMALHAALGVAIGSLLRNSAAAVGVTLMWAFVIEGILPLVIHQPEMVHWMPGGAVVQMLAVNTEPATVTPAAAAAVLAGYAVTLLASSILLDRTREL